MLNILNLTRTNKLILAAFAFVAVFALGSGRAHAATLNVTGGCTLPIAIDSVNAGADQSGCTATGPAYGTTDTITIPAGTQTLTADLPNITEPVVIQGAGMGQTTIDGDSQYHGFSALEAGTVTLSNMKITAYSSSAINLHESNVILSGINIDGTGSVPNGGELYGINILNHSASSITITTSNVYIHNFTISNNYLHAFIIDQADGGSITANIDKSTIDNIHGIGSQGINGFMTSIGPYGGDGEGTIVATITNSTVNDITSQDLTAPFNSFAYAHTDTGGSASITTNIHNLTITGVRGVTSTQPGFSGTDSAGFFAAGAAVNINDTATVIVNVDNSLMANNLNNGVSKNCSSIDMNPVFGGSGTVSNSIVSLGHNLSDDSSCANFNQTGDQQNVSNIISTLGSLQNNGGEVPTRALLDGSPAISAGGAVLGVTTDARGIARPSSNPSVGAYQYVAGASTSTPAAGGGTSAPDTGVGSVSLLAATIATLFGLLTLGYSLASKRS